MPETTTPYFDLETFFEKVPPVFSDGLDVATAEILAGAILSWLDLPKGWLTEGTPVIILEGNDLLLPAGTLARIATIDPTDAALPYKITWNYRDSSNGRVYEADGWASGSDFSTGVQVVE